MLIIAVDTIGGESRQCYSLNIHCDIIEKYKSIMDGFYSSKYINNYNGLLNDLYGESNFRVTTKCLKMLFLLNNNDFYHKSLFCSYLLYKLINVYQFFVKPNLSYFTDSIDISIT